MLIQTNTPIEIYKVIIKWLVIVKLYGNIPMILFIKINSNKKKKIKRKKYLFKLIVCLIVDCTNRYTSLKTLSTNDLNHICYTLLNIINNKIKLVI